MGTKCELVPDLITGTHKGYGFIEFEAQQAANDAIKAMNLFDLGGNYLRVGKAVAPPKNTAMRKPVAPSASILAAAAISANIQAQETVQNHGVTASLSSSRTSSRDKRSRNSRSRSSSRGKRHRSRSKDRRRRRSRSRSRDEEAE